MNLNEEVAWLQCGSSSGQNNETIQIPVATFCFLKSLEERTVAAVGQNRFKL